MKTKNIRTRPLARRFIRPLIATTALSAYSAYSYAQDGKVGMEKATNLVLGYFDDATKLMYAVGGVVGVIGAVKVYNAWSHGDQQVNKLAASWFGACVFLVVVAAVLKSFFNIP